MTRINAKKLSEDTPRDQQLRYVDIEGVGPSGLTEPPQPMIFGEAPSRARRLVNSADTIVSTVRTYLRAVWAVEEPCEDLVVSTGFAVVSPGPLVDRKYLSWALRSDIFIDEVVARSVGVSYPAIKPSDLGDIGIPVPPIAEQRAIADRLDRETGWIDKLIDLKLELLGLLELRWKTFLHERTRGANLQGPRRRLRAEWLGSIPSSWDFVQIRHLCQVRRGASPRPIEDPIYFDEDGEYAWVRISDVTASSMYLEKTTQRLSALGSSLSVKLPRGSIFVSIAGSVGKPIITNIKCCIHDGFVYFDHLKRVEPKYLFYLLRAGQLYLGLGKLGTQLNLNTDTVGQIQIPVPPVDVQREIVSSLDSCYAREIELEEELRQQLSLLRERRQAVITSVVLNREALVRASS